MASEQTFGDRVREMREELGLTQAQLAARFPGTSRGARTDNWIKSIEKGQQRLGLDDLPLIAEVLGADVRWLLTGEASGLTEFAARMIEIESKLDGRARRMLLANALLQAEEVARGEG